MRAEQRDQLVGNWNKGDVAWSRVVEVEMIIYGHIFKICKGSINKTCWHLRHEIRDKEKRQGS